MTERMKIMEEIRYRKYTHDCPSCGVGTYCAVDDGKSGSLCWCMHIESPQTDVYSGDKCYCKNCLKGE